MYLTKEYWLPWSLQNWRGAGVCCCERLSRGLSAQLVSASYEKQCFNQTILKIKIRFCNDDKCPAPTHIHSCETRPIGMAPFPLSVLVNFE